MHCVWSENGGGASKTANSWFESPITRRFALRSEDLKVLMGHGIMFTGTAIYPVTLIIQNASTLENISRMILVISI